PRPGNSPDLGLTTQLSFRADLAGHARDLGGEGVELIHHRVDSVLELQNLSLDGDGDLLGEVSVRDRRRDVGDIPNLRGEVRDHEVDAVGHVLPGAAYALDGGRPAELPL